MLEKGEKVTASTTNTIKIFVDTDHGSYFYNIAQPVIKKEGKKMVQTMSQEGLFPDQRSVKVVADTTLLLEMIIDKGGFTNVEDFKTKMAELKVMHF